MDRTRAVVGCCGLNWMVMMSMYEVVFPDPSREERRKVLLTLIGNPDVGRFRDCWVEKGENGPVIAIYTRNGGGNRAHSGDQPAGIDCSCTGCIAQFQLPAHSQYSHDADDGFDQTYATFYFKPPESPSLLEVLAAHAMDPVDTDARWHEAIDALKGPEASG